MLESAERRLGQRTPVSIRRVVRVGPIVQRTGYGPARRANDLSSALDEIQRGAVWSCSATRFWRNRLGSRAKPRGLDRHIDIASPVTIVGIAPEKMPGLEL
jgi:hypothetical protein